jgi:hypothetical protein
MEQLRGRKGIMFTLVTIVVVVLLLGEVLTYLYTNTQYSNLGVQSTPSLAATSLYNQVRLNSPSFLQASLINAFAALNAYEQSVGPNHQINAAYALGSLIDNGTVYGTSMSSYMGGYTITSYAAALGTQAKNEGLVASMGNENAVVFQSSSGKISVTFSTLLNVSSSYGTVAYPITANANVSIAGLPDLFGTSLGRTVTYTYNKSTAIGSTTAPLAKGSIYIRGNAIANAVTANYISSLSVYQFAAGPLFVDNVIPATCTDSAISSLPSGQAGNYILAAYNAFSISTNLCGFAGLVTYQANTINAPTKPYLVYNSVITQNVISYMKTGTRYILDGNTLSLYDPTALQSAVYSGSYFNSSFSPSYLNLISGAGVYFSPFGVAPLSIATRPVAAFNGISISNVVASKVPVSTVIGGFTTASFWMQWPTNQINLVPLSTNSYSIYVTGNAIGFSSTAGGNVLGTYIYGPGQFAVTPWVNIVAVFGNGLPGTGNDILYINGVKQSIKVLLGNPATAFPVALYAGSNVLIGGFGSGSTYSTFNGMMANLQLYNVALTPYQAYNLYISGIDSGPTNYSTLVGWWPLAGNFNDYSAYHNNGTAGSGVTWSNLINYPGSSLDGGTFDRGVLSGVQGISQCFNFGGCQGSGTGKIYVPVQQSYSSNSVQLPTSGFGLVNNTIPGSAYLNFADNDIFIANVIPTNGVATASGGDTVSFWMDWAPDGNTVSPVYFGNGFGLAGTATCFGIAGTTGVPYGVSTSTVSNRWVNIIAVLYDGGSPATGGTNYLYVNGTQQTAVGGCNTAPSGQSTTPSNTVYISGSPNFAGTFSGSLADVQVYNSILTTTQIGQLYLNNTVPGFKPAGWWPLSSGNNGFTNQTFALTGNYANEYNGIIQCTEANALGIGSPCGVAYLPFGVR